MKINIKILIYIYAIALFLITFLFAKEGIHALKTANYDITNLLIYAVLVCFFIYKIIKLGKISNSKND